MSLLEFLFCVMFVGGNQCELETSRDKEKPVLVEPIFTIKTGGGGTEPQEDPPKEQG